MAGYDPKQPRDKDGQWTKAVQSAYKASGLSLDPNLAWDPNGIGSMPIQQGEWYGRTRKMKPSEFLRLVPPMADKEGTLEWMQEALQEGEKFAPPVLFVRWNKETEIWQVENHEGRHRASAFLQVFGDVEMPVFLGFNNPGWRARNVNDRMLQAGLSPQKWRRWE